MTDNGTLSIKVGNLVTLMATFERKRSYKDKKRHFKASEVTQGPLTQDNTGTSPLNCQTLVFISVQLGQKLVYQTYGVMSHSQSHTDDPKQAGSLKEIASITLGHRCCCCCCCCWTVPVRRSNGSVWEQQPRNPTGRRRANYTCVKVS